MAHIRFLLLQRCDFALSGNPADLVLAAEGLVLVLDHRCHHLFLLQLLLEHDTLLLAATIVLR